MPILARILKDRGVVTEKQIEEALQHQVLYGGRLGTGLYELGLITEAALQDGLARAHGLPAGDADPSLVEPEAVRLLSKALAAKHKVCPYRVKGKTLRLFMLNPRDHVALAAIGFSLGLIVKPIVVPEFRMVQLLHEHYGVDERWRFDDTHRPRPKPIARLALDEAAARLEQATTRDEVLETLVGAGLGFFKRVLLFIVREPWLYGWSAAGEGADPGFTAGLRIPLDKPSVFQTITRDRTMFVGRFGDEEQNRAFLNAVGKKLNTTAAIFPVAIKSRVVNLVYGDNGPTGNVRATLGELVLLAQKAQRAYLRIIRSRIAETRKQTDEEEVPERKS